MRPARPVPAPVDSALPPKRKLPPSAPTDSRAPTAAPQPPQNHHIFIGSGKSSSPSSSPKAASPAVAAHRLTDPVHPIAAASPAAPLDRLCADKATPPPRPASDRFFQPKARRVNSPGSAARAPAQIASIDDASQRHRATVARESRRHLRRYTNAAPASGKHPVIEHFPRRRKCILAATVITPVRSTDGDFQVPPATGTRCALRSRRRPLPLMRMMPMPPPIPDAMAQMVGDDTRRYLLLGPLFFVF